MAQTDIGIRLSLDGQAAVTSGLRQVEGSMGGLTRATDLVGASFKNLAATAAAGLSVRAFVQAADAVTILNNQLKLATGSTQAASKAYTALFDIAQRSRVSFTELGGTFASIARAGEALGISQQRLLGVTEAISNAVAISGGSADSARASLVQLAQGLASGTLRGDELNSVMEQTPRLAKALADGLGVSTGKLREMGAAGEITADKVIKALESQARVLSGEVKDSVVTVGQAFTQLQNATTLAVGEFDKASGVSNTLAQALQGVAGMVQTVGAAFKENETAVKTTLGALAGLASVAIVGKLAAVATGIGGVSGALVILRGVVASLNPWTLALLVGGTAVGAVNAYADAQSKTIAGITSELRNLQRLNAQAAADPSDAILNAKVKQRIAEIARLRGELEKLNTAQKQADAPIGSVGSGDTALRRELARQEALNKPAAADTKAAAKAAADAISQTNKALETYNALVSKGTGYSADYNAKLADLALLQKRGKINTQELADARAQLEQSQPYAIEQAKMWSEQTKASTKAIADSISAYEQYTKALDDSADAAAAQVQKLQDEEAAATIAAAQNISLAQAIEQVAIARLAEAQAKEYSLGNQEAGDAIKREIEQRKLLATALGSKETRDASIKSAKEAVDDWKKASEKINDSITDALLRGFESGKGFAENLRDTVVNMFKTMVLRPVIQGVVGAGLSAVGLNAAAASVTGSGIGAGLSGATAAGSMAALVPTFGQGFMSTLAGNSITSTAVAASATGAGTAATVAGTVGAVAPYVLAAAAVYTLLTREKNYVKSTGDAAVNFGATGGVTSASDFKGQSYEANVSTAANKFVTDLNAEYLKAAKSLDLGAVASAFAFGSNDAGKFRIGSSAGGVSFNSGELDQSPEAIKLAASRAVFAAIQGSELPGYLSKAFNGITAGSASQEQITSALGFAQSLKAVRFGLLDATAQQAEYQTIIDAGIASLGTSADTFKTDFIAAIDSGLTPEGLAEWSALGGTMQALEAITKKANEELGKVGRSIADIANERKGLQTQLDELTLSSVDLIAKQRTGIDASNVALFDQVQAQLALKDATDKAAEAAEREAEIRTGFQQRFDVLSGVTTARQQALQADLASTTDTTTQALIKQVYAQEDAATAAEASAAALSKAADALRNTLQAALDASRSGVADAVAAVRTSVDAQKAVVTTAYNTQAEAIKASLDTVGGSIGKLQSLSGSLKSTLDGMRIAGGEAVYRAAAQAQITAALATARAGGGLPVNGQLDNALRTVSQPSEDLFASFAEYAFDFNRTAGEIAALNDLTTTKLTGEELTQNLLKTQADNLKTGFDAELKRLDDLVTAAQAQADAATKSTTSLQSLAVAIDKFTASLGVTLTNSLATAFGTYDANSSSGVDFTEFASAFGGMASEATLKLLFDKTDANGDGQISQLEAINANTANLLARMTISGTGGNQAGAGTYTGTQVADAIKATTAAGQTPAQIIANASSGYGVTSTSVAAVAAVTGNTALTDYQKRIDATVPWSAAEKEQVVSLANARTAALGKTPEYWLYQAAIDAGYNAGMVDKKMGFPNGTTNGWALANGYPAFAKGSNYLPNDTMALLHEGEAVIPKAYNPYNPNAAGGNARLESLVEGLTKEVQRLQGIVNDGNRSNERIAEAVNGRPDAPMLVETV